MWPKSFESNQLLKQTLTRLYKPSSEVYILRYFIGSQFFYYFMISINSYNCGLFSKDSLSMKYYKNARKSSKDYS